MDSAYSGTYFKVPLQDAIFEAKQYLLLQDTVTDDDFLEILAWRAVRRINGISSYKTEVRELEICNNEATLPKDLFRFLWFRICDYDFAQPGTQPMTTMFNFLYADIPFLNDCGCNTGNQNTINAFSIVRINNGKLIFTNKKELGFNKIHLAGIYFNTDDNGVFVLNDNMVPAVVYRICSEYALVHASKYKPIQIQMWQQQAMAMANKVRSDDFKINFQNNIDQVQSMYRGYNYAPLVSRNRSRY